MGVGASVPIWAWDEREYVASNKIAEDKVSGDEWDIEINCE